MHTFLLRFPLDLVMLDRDGRVLEVRRGVRPWRVVVPKERTFACLELPARPGGPGVEPGASLRLELPAQGRPRLPRALSGWYTDA